MRIVLPATLLLSMIWAIPAALAWDFKEIRDISVRCSNGLTCVLQLAAVGGGQEPVRLGLHRRAGEGTRPEILIETPARLAAGSDVVVRADGQTVATIASDDMSDEYEGRSWRLTDEATVADIVDAMRRAARLTVNARSGDGSAETAFSLSGVVAGLIFIDEIQGRLETPDALQVKGEKAVKPVAARDITALDEIPHAIAPQFTGPDGECSFMDPGRLRYASGFEVGLGDGSFLVVMPCAEGGAYNQPYVLFSRYGDEMWPVPVPFMSDEGPSAERMIWNVDYNHGDRTLTGFFKGRGLGDCGSYDRWKLDDGGAGIRLILVESRSKGDCDGDYAGGPENWPASWPPKNQ